MFPCFFTLLSVDCAKRWVVFTVNFVNNGYNRLTGILFVVIFSKFTVNIVNDDVSPKTVARKYTNESFLASSIALTPDNSGKQIDQNITKVKMPYFYSVDIQDQIGIDNDQKPLYATVEVISKEPFPKEWIVEKYSPVEIPFTNKCGKCHKEGRPTVQKKDNKDYTHYKSDYDREEYRLIYNHKQEDKTVTQCIIASFDSERGIFTEKGKLSQRAHHLIFPNYLND